MGNEVNGDPLIELGFASSSEFHEMVAAADISSPEKMATFRCWQECDGTKAGLEELALSNEAPNKPCG